MNHRLKLGLGLGLALAVALVLALVLLRPDQQRQQQSSRESGPSEQAPATPRSVGPSSPPSATPETDPRPDAVLAPTGEQRDATGELLSDGPAKVAELPERPPEALANTPDAETSAAARAAMPRVLWLRRSASRMLCGQAGNGAWPVKRPPPPGGRRRTRRESLPPPRR